MSNQTTTYTANGSWSPPANVIGTTVTVSVLGGSAGFLRVGHLIRRGICAFLNGTIPLTDAPFTIVVGVSQTGVASAGTNGYSGGGGGGATVGGGTTGGGGSSAILRTSDGTLLVEAGGGDGPGDDDGAGNTSPGGSAGGFASNTPVNATGTGTGGGSGGAHGGNGANGGSGAGHGTGHGGGINGNAASGATSGAGVGSGGLAVPGCGACFAHADLGTSYSYGLVASGSSTVTVTARVADAPNAPTNVSPTTNQFVDGANDGVTFEGTYNTPGGDTGALEAVRLLIIQAGVTKYWNGVGLVSSPANAPLATGLGAINGGDFTVAIPPGILTDNTVYSYSLQTIESFAGLVSPSSSPVTFDSVQFPTVLITAPTEGQFVSSLTPTISWSDTIPSGSQIDYRVVLYATTSAPDQPPGDVLHNLVGNPGAIWDTFVVASAGTSTSVPYTWAFNTLPLVSITEYTAFVQIASTGGAPSNWARVDFTVQLQWLAPPTLAVIASAEPTSGMPAPRLTMTADDNAVSPRLSSSEGIYTPLALTNCTVLPDLSWATAQGNFSTAVKSTAGGTMTVALDKVTAQAGDTIYGQAAVHNASTARTATLTVEWFNSSNTLLRTDTLGTGSDSGGVTLAGTSSAAPANTAYGQLFLSWASTATNEIHQFDSVLWSYGAASSPWYLGVGLVSSAALPTTATQEASEFQGDYVGNGTWNDIVASASTATTIVDGSGTTCQTYDMSAPFNQNVWYRVRNLVTLSAFSASGVAYPAQTVVSPWSSTVELVGGVASKQWWAVPPTAPLTALGLHRLRTTGGGLGSTLTTPASPPTPQGLSASISIDEQEQLGLFRPFGRSTGIAVHGDVWADEFDLALYFLSSAEFAAFKAIRALQQTVLLKSDMESQIYWVTIGPDFNRGIVQETGRQTNPKSGLLVHCTPADPVWGG